VLARACLSSNVDSGDANASGRFMFMRQLMRHRAYIHFYLVRVPKALQLAEYDNM
jgi:hypothetical protein